MCLAANTARYSDENAADHVGSEHDRARPKLVGEKLPPIGIHRRCEVRHRSEHGAEQDWPPAMRRQAPAMAALRRSKQSPTVDVNWPTVSSRKFRSASGPPRHAARNRPAVLTDRLPDRTTAPCQVTAWTRRVPGAGPPGSGGGRPDSSAAKFRPGRRRVACAVDVQHVLPHAGASRHSGE